MKLKEGMRIRILQDKLQNADVCKGDTLVITRVEEHTIFCSPWAFNSDLLGSGFEIVDKNVNLGSHVLDIELEPRDLILPERLMPWRLEIAARLLAGVPGSDVNFSFKQALDAADNLIAQHEATKGGV